MIMQTIVDHAPMVTSRAEWRHVPGALPTKGRLLVATPPLGDPNFDRTVVYVLEHHDNGAIGVVINRPIDRERSTRRSIAGSTCRRRPRSVFSGGPVEEDALIALADGRPT